MKNSEWIDVLQDLLKGVERELRPPISVEATEVLRALRKQLSDARVLRRRKKFERELDEALEGNPLLRAATERYLGEKSRTAVAAAEVVLRRAERCLAQFKVNRRRGNTVKRRYIN